MEFSDNSDSEEEFDRHIQDCLEIMRRPRLIKRSVRDYQNPLEFHTDVEFKTRYRLDRATVFDVLLPMVSNCVYVKQTPIPTLNKLLIALRFYASGCFQFLNADLNRVSQPTVSRIVKSITLSLCKRRGRFVKFPADLSPVRTEFHHVSRFPNAIGCIDCAHVPIQRPRGPYGKAFRNPRGFFSVNVEIACGPNSEIFNVAANRPGSVCDDDIFSVGSLKTRLEAGRLEGIVLGDNAYGCRPYLLTPVARPKSPAERKYNECHARARKTVDRTIGAWKRMFPCLSNKMATDVTTTCNVIVATAILFNICRERNIDIDKDVVIASCSNDHDETISSTEGLTFRKRFIEEHFSE